MNVLDVALIILFLLLLISYIIVDEFVISGKKNYAVEYEVRDYSLSTGVVQYTKFNAQIEARSKRHVKRVVEKMFLKNITISSVKED